jgi:hypothetical protein
MSANVPALTRPPRRRGKTLGAVLALLAMTTVVALQTARSSRACGSVRQATGSSVGQTAYNRQTACDRQGPRQRQRQGQRQAQRDRRHADGATRRQRQ